MKSLDKLKELHAKTSQGEWKVNHGHFNGIVSSDDEGHFVLAEMNRNMPNFKNDEIFIVEAHKYLPRLIDALNECRSQRNLYLDQIYGNGFLVEKSASHDDRELEQILEGKE